MDRASFSTWQQSMATGLHSKYPMFLASLMSRSLSCQLALPSRLHTMSSWRLHCRELDSATRCLDQLLSITVNGPGLHDTCNLVFHASNLTPWGWHCQVLFLPFPRMLGPKLHKLLCADLEKGLSLSSCFGAGNSLSCFLSSGFLLSCKFAFLWSS